MGYNKECLSEALEDIKNTGKIRKATYNNKVNTVKENNPRLTQLENEIMKLGPMISILAISGDLERMKAVKAKCLSLTKEKEEILTKNNIEPYQSLCEKCKDTGYVGANLCDCVLKRAKEISFAKLSREMPLDDSSFENFSLDYYDDEQQKNSMKKIFEYLKSYAENVKVSRESLLLFGGTGLGKTHLSLAIAKKALEKGMGVIYSPTHNILNKLENEHFSYSKTSTPILDDVMTCDMLILDDLGAEFSTPFTLALIYNIINTRLLANRPTIISTNLSLEEIEARYTPRVASRIMGCYTIKKFVGKDIRQIKRIEALSKQK